MHTRLAEIRNKLHFAQNKFGDKLGVLTVTYVKYERGERKPPYEMLIKLYKDFNVNLNWLITGDGEMFIQNKSPQDEELMRSVTQIVEKILEKKGLN